MRLCRYQQAGQPQIGIYDEKRIVPLAAAVKLHNEATHQQVKLPESGNLLELLPPAPGYQGAKQVAAWVARNEGNVSSIALPTEKVELLVPIPRPNKLFLLAGNYASHIEEGGGKASERQETFPYVFMKPPSTTLAHPGKPVKIPKVSPNSVDWECELAVIIGRECRHIKEADALSVVAGYTVINDISDRKFRPNPGRKQRDKDAFFDWLHGKWHDSFCPCGPCVACPESVPDPQKLPMKLSVSGTMHQDASTALQIFPVAAVIEFISNIVTLEPGDIISTGTPAGVGNAKGIYLKPGDRVEATIGSIGTLVSPVVAE